MHGQREKPRKDTLEGHSGWKPYEGYGRNWGAGFTETERTGPGRNEDLLSTGEKKPSRSHVGQRNARKYHVGEQDSTPTLKKSSKH